MANGFDPNYLKELSKRFRKDYNKQNESKNENIHLGFSLIELETNNQIPWSHVISSVCITAVRKLINAGITDHDDPRIPYRYSSEMYLRKRFQLTANKDYKVFLKAVLEDGTSLLVSLESAIDLISKEIRRNLRDAIGINKGIDAIPRWYGEPDRKETLEFLKKFHLNLPRTARLGGNIRTNNIKEPITFHPVPLHRTQEDGDFTTVFTSEVHYKKGSKKFEHTHLFAQMTFEGANYSVPKELEFDEIEFDFGNNS